VGRKWQPTKNTIHSFPPPSPPGAARRCSLPGAGRERLVFYCRTTSANTAPCTSRRMCCPAHCARYCAPCQTLLRAFPGWIRSPPPTVLDDPPHNPRPRTAPRDRHRRSLEWKNVQRDPHRDKWDSPLHLSTSWRSSGSPRNQEGRVWLVLDGSDHMRGGVPAAPLIQRRGK